MAPGISAGMRTCRQYRIFAPVRPQFAVKKHLVKLFGLHAAR
jgi:hypothetical protein